MPDRANRERLYRYFMATAAALGFAGIVVGGVAWVVIQYFAPNPRAVRGTVNKYTCLDGSVLIRGLDDDDNVVRVCVPGRKPIVERDYAAEK